LITVISDPNEEDNAKEFISSLTKVHFGEFRSDLEKVPPADLNKFGLDEDLQFEFVKEMSIKTKSSCLFVKDSGHESILA